jgi:hypothetical protein
MYNVPLNGTFYVPPSQAALVSAVPPTAGDFAVGARTLDSKVIVAVGALVGVLCPR